MQKNGAGVDSYEKEGKPFASDNLPKDYENSLELEKRKKKKRKGSKKIGRLIYIDVDVESESEVEEESERDEEDCQFEVEAVLDDKKIEGVLHYLIRWKGYGSESDTWEPESTLRCNDLITEYQSTSKSSVKKMKLMKKEIKTKRNKNSKSNWNKIEPFEVERILEVHFKRNGDREFLVSWKGYPASDNSWEPEENLKCQDIIEKFMLKVEQAKNIDQKQLRDFRKPTERLTLNMQETSRHLSRRFRGKRRVQYHDAQ